MSDTGHNDIQSGEARRAAHRRRRRWLWPALLVLVVAVGLGIVFAMQSLRAVTVDAISPAPGALVSDTPVTVSCGLSRFRPGSGTLTFTVDGQPVPAEQMASREGVIQARLSLADGAHTVALSYDPGGLFARTVSRTWDFSVDSTAPTIAVGAPSSFPLFRARNTGMVLRFSEPATVSLTLDGVAVPTDLAGGAADKAQATIAGEEGEHIVVASVADRAGNVTRQQWDVIIDYKDPELTVVGLPDGDVWNDANFAAVDFAVADHFANTLTVTATLDGVALPIMEGASPAAETRAFSFKTGNMAEGTHNLAVSATDSSGQATTYQRSFLVDTSSMFGTSPLTIGAIGTDVQQLQRILKLKGVYAGDPTGTYEEDTGAAVAAFNARYAVPGGSSVTVQTLKYLLGYIVVDVSERKLYLYDGGDTLLQTYGVAVGMPAHPTPIGSFRIISKLKNPTWNPPDSAWAAGMGPIPPGADNPLGTRWMGLNSPGIGIHGTPAPSSIGTAASHGCLRMRIPEVEELFDRAYVGTPVQIVE